MPAALSRTPHPCLEGALPVDGGHLGLEDLVPPPDGEADGLPLAPADIGRQGGVVLDGHAVRLQQVVPRPQAGFLRRAAGALLRGDLGEGRPRSPRR